MAAKRITGDMVIGDVVAAYPQTIPIFLEYGLHCIGCSVAAGECLSDGAGVHGIEGKRFEMFLNELNTAVAGKNAPQK